MTTSACEGPVGPAGEDGADGQDGNANVIYSDWMDFDWNLADGTTFKQMYIEEARVVDEDFMASGALVVYFKLESGATTALGSLPFTNGTDHLYALIGDVPGDDVQGIVINLDATDGTSPVQSDWSDYQLRYVMIPGGVPASELSTSVKGDLDPNDYELVKARFGIPDDGAGEVRLEGVHP